MTPETMLSLTANLVGAWNIVASLQGPHQHYESLGQDARPAYNWGIRHHWESAVKLHHDIVLQTLASLELRFRIPRRRMLLVGFSQPVGMNYRLLATYPDQVGGVLAICGGVPRDWEDGR
jgi:predicted esterase